MNRLILIGNGFDLAHKMKTSYNDFILWYLKKSFNQAINDGTYEDALLKIERLYHWPAGRYGNIETLDELIDYFFTQNSLHKFFKVSEFEIKNYRGVIYENPFKTKFNSEFMEVLITKCSHKNWVDIENEFYEELKKALPDYELKQILPTHDTTREKRLKGLNNSMEVLINELENYLKSLESPEINPEYNKIFNSLIYKTDVIGASIEQDQYPQKTMYLNFNYTETIKKYGVVDSDLNFIHGRIGDVTNPIIFGFGDELDEVYKEMEKEKVRGFFKYIKSFGYLELTIIMISLGLLN